MDATLACGYCRRISRKMPRPVTWLGRQANGCTTQMLGTPSSIMSIISPTRYQPSPDWLPNWTICCASSTIREMWVGTSKRWEVPRAASTGFWYCWSTARNPFLRKRFHFSVPNVFQL